MAAVLQVGRVTAGLGWLRCRAGHESEACRLQGWAAGLAQVSTGLRFPCTCAWARPTLLPPTSLAHSAAGRCVRCPCAHGKQLSPAPFCLLSSAPPAAPRLPRLRSAADEAGLVQGWARAVHPRLLEHQLHHAPRLHLVRLSRLPISVLPFAPSLNGAPAAPHTPATPGETFQAIHRGAALLRHLYMPRPVDTFQAIHLCAALLHKACTAKELQLHRLPGLHLRCIAGTSSE